jgi:hypothetical protein
MIFLPLGAADSGKEDSPRTGGQATAATLTLKTVGNLRNVWSAKAKAGAGAAGKKGVSPEHDKSEETI